MPRGTWQGGGTWQTSGGGGGGLLLAVIVAAVLIGSGAASAAVSALEVIAVAIACAAVLAVAGGIALLVYRARSDRPRAVYSARPVYQLPPDPRPELSSEHKPAIEPPRETHIHFHVSAAELAAIMRHHTEGK